ncbi:MAG: hypothetical protein Q8P40_10995 [Nitrospirota bacterium]|nr:hypothetical protein [Nitrospirota bacterium]
MADTRELEEYKALRNEILVRGRGIGHLLIASLVILVPFISTIILYVMQNSEKMKGDPSLLYSYIFLFPLLIIIPCAFFIVALRKDIYRYGTYIEIFFEEGSDGPKWETALSKLRQIRCEESLDPTFWLYWALFFICSGFFGYTLFLLKLQKLHLLVPLIVALFLVKAHLTYKKTPTKIRKNLYNNWLSVRDDLMKNSKRITMENKN